MADERKRNAGIVTNSLTNIVRYAIMFRILEKYGKRRVLHYGGRKEKHTDLRGLKETGR